MEHKSPDNLMTLTHAAFPSLAESYACSWGLACLLVDAEGSLLAGTTGCARAESDCAHERRRAVDEAMRWGEASLLLTSRGYLLWAVPVMYNSRVLGGLVVERGEGEAPELTPEQTRHAMADLLTLAEEANLTNAALLELRRQAARVESERAEAIHELKEQNYQSIRDVYLVEEPALISAIKRGDRTVAREILNRVLVGIYYL
ncbi:MAG: PocR ligand-binding domain-containing protein, partial [bacterium]